MFQPTKTQLLDMFVDRTPNESYKDNRLLTTQTSADSVALIGYGWLKLAEYNEERQAVTVFTGHKSLRSKTVSRWLNDAIKRANDRGRDVILSGESPTVNTPNSGVQYVGNYVSMDGKHSAVEADVVGEVVESLADLDPSDIDA